MKRAERSWRGLTLAAELLAAFEMGARVGDRDRLGLKGLTTLKYRYMLIFGRYMTHSVGCWQLCARLRRGFLGPISICSLRLT